MSREYNSMSFTPEEVKKGLHTSLIDYLISLQYSSEHRFNDIHITSDSYCLIVEWVFVPFDHSYGGSFQYVDEDEHVMREVELPSGGYEFIFADEDPNEYLKDWLKEHPGWTRDHFGHWTYEKPEKK